MREITPDNYQPDSDEIEDLDYNEGEEVSEEEMGSREGFRIEDDEKGTGKPAAPSPDSPRPRKKKKGLIALLVLAIVVVGVYLTGFIVFQTTYFMPKTQLNQVDVSWKTDEEAQELLTADVENYSLTVLERNNHKEVLKGSDFGVKAKLDNKVADALAGQDNRLWFVNIFKDKEIHLEDIAVYDEDALNEKIPTLDCMDLALMQPSINATISDTMADGAFTIVDEVYGTVVIPDNVYKAINGAVAGMEPTVDLSEKECYIDPVLKADSDQAKAALDAVNSLTGFTITYEMTGRDPYLIDGNKMRGWIDVSDDLTVTFDDEAVTDFVETFAAEYNTAFTEREFVNHAGETVTVPGGYYGWELDQEAEEELLREELAAKQDVTREPVWKRTAISLGEHEYGNKYIEVDLSRQTVYLMEDGTVKWETPCVTGKTSRRHGTTPGMYSIYIKQRNRTLNGRNDDGSEYHTPVSYWMPFNGGQGLHDARWRSRFGGTIYVYSGSHGCVNLPTSAAAELYDMVDEGTPVIVYWSNGG